MTLTLQNQNPAIDVVVADPSFYTPEEAAAIQKLNIVMQKLADYFVEREDVIETAFVAILCKHHILLIGPPGTAKTYLISSICKALGDMSFFTWLLTKYTTPDEIFGPYSISELKQDRLIRKTEGKMPEAKIVYLDEIFNASSSIINTLLTIMHERTHQNQPVPLECLFGSTNFTPEERSTDAFFDRFIFRLFVDYIHEPENFAKMMLNSQHKFELQPEEILTHGEIQALQAKVKDVKIDHLLPKLSELWNNLRKDNLQVSDRRFAGEWIQSALRARAVINGRSEVNQEDLFVLEHILWNNKADIAPIKMLITKMIDPAYAQIQTLLGQADSIQKSIQPLDQKNPKELQEIKEALLKIGQLLKESEGIFNKNVFDKKTERAIIEAINYLKKIRTNIAQAKLPDLMALLAS